MEANSGAKKDGAKGTGGRPGGKGRYHHGDLRNALIRAATQLAGDGGPDAVVLRAAAREVGVSATAAYRHFAGQAELLHAVKELGQERLGARMEAAGREVAGEGPDAAVERVMALGRGYIEFAQAEPGLFRTAFCRATPGPAPGEGEGATHFSADGWEARSFRLLTESLDALVACGRMSPERRRGAELSAWAMVHGLAVLVLDGPLGDLRPEAVRHIAERSLRDILDGLTSG